MTELPPFPMPTAKTVAPADLRDTTLLKPDVSRQIAPGSVESRAGVVYREAAGRELKLDLLRPAGPGRFPLVVYVPGGAFLLSDRTSAAHLRTHVAEAGFVVCSVEYRTVGDGATYADSVQDVDAAVAFVRDRFGIDGKVAVWGESAGGYVAAMTALLGTGVDAVIDAFGSSDLSAIAADFDEDMQAFFTAQPTHLSAYVGAPGQALKDIPAQVRAADPATYATKAAPPFLLLHGSRDTLISPGQTQHLHQALLAAGADSTRYVLDGADHGDLSFLGRSDSGLPWSSRTTMDVITDFLHRHLDS